MMKVFEAAAGAVTKGMIFMRESRGKRGNEGGPGLKVAAW